MSKGIYFFEFRRLIIIIIIVEFILLLFLQSALANSYIVLDTGNNSLVFINKYYKRYKVFVKKPREIINGFTKNVYFISGGNEIYEFKNYDEVKKYFFNSEVRGINKFLPHFVVGVLKDEDRMFILDTLNSSIKYFNLKCKGPRQTYVDRNVIFIVGNSSNTVDIFDLITQRVIKSFDTNLRPYSIFVDYNNIYIGSIESETVVAYDKNSFKEKWKSININHPTKIIKLDDLLYITNFDENSITVLNKNNGKKISTVKVKESPFDIKIFDKKIFISSNIGSIEIYDMSFNFLKSIGDFKDLHHFLIKSEE